MRFVYLDESDVGNPENEPFVVVAGVIIDADRQLRAIQKWLPSMIEDYVHPDQRQNFCFHAHQIFHGNGVFNVLAQTSAAGACLISIQRFMSHFPEEVATVVYENHDQEKKSIRQTHNFLKDGANTEVMREQISDWSELLPMSILMLRDSIRRG